MAAAALDIDMSRKSKAGFRLLFQSQAFFVIFLSRNAMRRRTSFVLFVCVHASPLINKMPENVAAQWNFLALPAVYYLMPKP